MRTLIISIRDIEPVQDCDSLNVYDLESEIEKVLVPVVKDYPKSDDCFTGIYCSDLPQNSFISVNETPVMIMPTISKNPHHIHSTLPNAIPFLFYIIYT